MKKRGKHDKELKIKNRNKINFLSILLRYSILLVLGIFLSVFYTLLLPLTLWPVYFLLNLFYDVSLTGNILLISGAEIEIIGACVAGSAYYLLLILNLTTSMKPKQRFHSILFSFSSLLVLNILRILFLSILYLENFSFFDFTHKLFWYFISIIFVVGIWFLTVRIFKIKNIPIYSDIKRLCVK